MTDTPKRIWVTMMDPEVSRSGVSVDLKEYPTKPNHDAVKYIQEDTVADRIEALTADLAAARAELASGSFYKEADIDKLMTRAEAAEAKLVQAVEVLAFYAKEENYVGEYLADACGCCGTWYEPKIHADGEDSGNKARAFLVTIPWTQDQFTSA